MSTKEKVKLDKAQAAAVEALQKRKKSDTNKMRAICAMEADRLRERLK